MTGPEQFAAAREAAKREFDERAGNRSKPYMREDRPVIEEPESPTLEVIMRAIREHDLELVIRRRTEVEEEEGERVKGCL